VRKKLDTTWTLPIRRLARQILSMLRVRAERLTEEQLAVAIVFTGLPPGGKLINRPSRARSTPSGHSSAVNNTTLTYAYLE